MPYSRTSRQTRHDLSSCIIDTKPVMRNSYGYLKETPKHPARTSYTHTELKKDAKVFIAQGLNFDDFRKFVDETYVGNPDFIWRTTNMKTMFEAHMAELKKLWPLSDN